MELEMDFDDEEFEESEEIEHEELDDSTKKVLIEMYRNRFLNNHKKCLMIPLIYIIHKTY